MMTYIKNLFRKKDSSDIKEVAEKQLQENIGVIKSLRDYDEGRKEISTTNIETRLPDIRTAR